MNTKTILFSTIIVLFLALQPNNTQAQIKVGPIVGLNFSDMTGDTQSDGMLVGFHLGFLVNLGITDYFMIEPQLLYSTKGAKGKSDDLNLGYVEIPIWLRYQLSNGLNFNAGPYAGILTSAKDGDTKIKDNYNAVDYGLAAGIGYQTHGGIGLNASYFSGLADIGDRFITPFGNYDFDTKVNVIKLSLSYTIGGKRE